MFFHGRPKPVPQKQTDDSQPGRMEILNRFKRQYFKVSTQPLPVAITKNASVYSDCCCFVSELLQLFRKLQQTTAGLW